MSSEPYFIVFSDDWGRHPSSCQHLFRQLLPRYRSFWVNTIGMRRPQLNLSTFKRGWEKIRQWSRKTQESPTGPPPENLTISNPRMWPSFASKLSRKMNRALLSRHLTRLSAGRSGNPIVVTTIPIVAELVSRFPDWRWVYYCVDDFGEWPGVDQKTMQVMEKQLVTECHRFVTVSQTLKDKLEAMGQESLLLTHGVDLEFWRTVPEDRSYPEVEKLEKPLVVFWGVVDRRMDVAWMRALSEKMQQGTILLVGPSADPDPELLSLRRTHYLPPQPFELLPLIAHYASVLVMPYADLPVTRAMQPLKLKEYLATGKPTVVRNLPSNAEWGDCMDIASTPEQFISTVQSRISTGLPAEQREARRRLEAESWQAKAAQFEHWLLSD